MCIKNVLTVNTDLNGLTKYFQYVNTSNRSTWNLYKDISCLFIYFYFAFFVIAVYVFFYDTIILFVILYFLFPVYFFVFILLPISFSHFFYLVIFFCHKLVMSTRSYSSSDSLVLSSFKSFSVSYWYHKFADILRHIYFFLFSLVFFYILAFIIDYQLIEKIFARVTLE